MYFRTNKGRATRVPGWELDYFNSQEWLNVQDRLDERERENVEYTPRRNDLFRALSLCHYSDCNVIFVGQDPYPNPANACGVAFGLPEDRRRDVGEKSLPPSLRTIFTELTNDLGLPWPKTGDLTPWCRQGVLLWNAMPVYPPIADFGPLTQEIIERLSGKGKIVFVFCGRRAQNYAEYVDPYNNRSIFVSHPSPRGQRSTTSKFVGSRVFSTINAHLNHYVKEVIDWTL